MKYRAQLASGNPAIALRESELPTSPLATALPWQPSLLLVGGAVCLHRPELPSYAWNVGQAFIPGVIPADSLAYREIDTICNYRGLLTPCQGKETPFFGRFTAVKCGVWGSVRGDVPSGPHPSMPVPLSAPRWVWGLLGLRFRLPIPNQENLES